MKKSLKTGVGAALLLLALSGCAVSEQREETRDINSDQYQGESQDLGAESGTDLAPRSHYAFYQDLPGGGQVLCVWASESYRSGGLSCDWAGASNE